jgi:alpha(1,3/1,4) fucosyltransferase
MGVIMSRAPVVLWVDPLSYHLERDRLWDLASSPGGGEGILGPYVHLRERLAELGVPVHTGDLLVRGDAPAASLNLYVTMGAWTRYRRLVRRSDTILSAFMVNECPIVEPRLYADLDKASTAFRRMFSFAGDDAMQPFIRSHVHFEPFRYPYPFSSVRHEAWSRRDRSFLAIINGNKVPRLDTQELYSERLRAIAYFEALGEIDVYGVGWDGPPFRVGQTRVPKAVRRLAYLAERRWDRFRPDPLVATARRAWRGTVPSKSATLSGYTFAICFENQVMQGWVTEKIFDCLVAGTIPVYLGAPDIDDWVDTECYVDMRRFPDYGALRDYLRGLSPAEIDAYREAGREYFRSERFFPFTKEAFAEIFLRFLAEDADVTA